jgi:hypothetical protein
MNPDTRSISVEWLEKGETKGKEVRLITVSNTNSNKYSYKNNNTFFILYTD